MKTKIAIIGNGCAATAAIEAMCDAGFDGEISVFSNSSVLPYNPMLTTYYLSGKINFEGLLLRDDFEAFYSKNNVKIHQATVSKLDSHGKIITDSLGNTYHFDKCIITSGASPFVPPIEGHDGNNVFVVRTADDVLKIKRFMEAHPVRRALVVGASMVGIKLAEFFAHEGIECCLADAARNIFPLAAHKNCSKIIEKIVMENGVSLRLGGAISKIEHDSDCSRAYFSDSSVPTECDIVIMSIGTRPNLSFIDREQININRAILVDDNMSTSSPDVFASGDCTEGKDIISGEAKIIGLLANARYQGRTAGLCAIGSDISHCGSSPHNITYFMGIDFIGIGDVNAEGEIFEYHNPKTHEYARIVSMDGKILSANLINMKEISGILRNLIFNSNSDAVQTAGYSYAKYAEELIKARIREARVNARNR